jgi:hypothetical protein
MRKQDWIVTIKLTETEGLGWYAPANMEQLFREAIEKAGMLPASIEAVKDASYYYGGQ